MLLNTYYTLLTVVDQVSDFQKDTISCLRGHQTYICKIITWNLFWLDSAKNNGTKSKSPKTKKKDTTAVERSLGRKSNRECIWAQPLVWIRYEKVFLSVMSAVHQYFLSHSSTSRIAHPDPTVAGWDHVTSFRSVKAVGATSRSKHLMASVNLSTTLFILWHGSQQCSNWLFSLLNSVAWFKLAVLLFNSVTWKTRLAPCLLWIDTRLESKISLCCFLSRRVRGL